MRYALVIPALNEEEAIAVTLRRALAARAKVVAQTPVTEMFVVFVNDGSTDRTQEIVDTPEFDAVVKVRFERNRGYGAAIKAGWRATEAELVGFMDADGTCDPDFSVPLVRRLLETGADVVLANRMNSQSKMPPVRKLGNAFFARLLALLSGRRLSDSASGFRIVRRSSLRWIAPLPDRLHFTPAMSSICLLDGRLRVEEVPMPYEERIGRSKLSVVRDGLRFLDIMLFTAALYRPGRVLGVSALFLLLLFVVLGWGLQAAERSGAAVLAVVVGLLLGLLVLGVGWLIRKLHRLVLGGFGSPVREGLGAVPSPATGRSEAASSFAAARSEAASSFAAGARATQPTSASAVASDSVVPRSKPEHDYAGLAGGGAGLAVLGAAIMAILGFGPRAPGRISIDMLLAIPALIVLGGAAISLLGLLVRVVATLVDKREALLHDQYSLLPPSSDAAVAPPAGSVPSH